MAIFRWIIFLPAAFIVSILIGAMMKFAAQVYFPEWISWGVSGAFSGVAFMLTGFRIAPRITKMVKWTLIVIVGMIGLMSAIGSLIGENKIGALAGAIMVVVAFLFTDKPVDEISAEVK